MPEARDKKSTRMRLLHFLLSGEGRDHWIFPEKIFAFRKFVGAFVLYHVFIFSIIENRAESCVSLCRLVQFQTALKQKQKKKKKKKKKKNHVDRDPSASCIRRQPPPLYEG